MSEARITAQGFGPAGSPDVNQAIGDFVSALIYGQAGRFADYTSIAVMDGEAVIAGVLYHHYEPDAGVIELSAAATDRRWLTRPVLKAMFSYPFVELGCQLCVLRVAPDNRPMLRIAKAYGFNEYVIPRLRGRDQAEHILTLTDDDWKSNRFNKGRTDGKK